MGLTIREKINPDGSRSKAIVSAYCDVRGCKKRSNRNIQTAELDRLRSEDIVAHLNKLFEELPKRTRKTSRRFAICIPKGGFSIELKGLWSRWNEQCITVCYDHLKLYLSQPKQTSIPFTSSQWSQTIPHNNRD